ncbi:uncharacterized protein BDR25DRAFT_310653 [Lindgomyces ingoldianus]|uniref:Uncharacterized protein n=1 Tax=Lindgomyces ingoldianus TaxID=673940 RepID=A0ACB6R7J6_9PLEO|nr:uncharacterized protein BDR25DRAFT_310653 [Lindgomyces ingoldianus]KAF2475229.1 hypothetical protein BDR25DRAFT_310653 [Lindgomyces ingoldianus]
MSRTRDSSLVHLYTPATLDPAPVVRRRSKTSSASTTISYIWPSRYLSNVKPTHDNDATNSGLAPERALATRRSAMIAGEAETLQSEGGARSEENQSTTCVALPVRVDFIGGKKIIWLERNGFAKVELLNLYEGASLDRVQKTTLVCVVRF